MLSCHQILNDENRIRYRGVMGQVCHLVYTVAALHTGNEA